MSIFEGKLVEIPEIAIDRFEGEGILESTAYFLTHCHSDHTKGLNTDHFRRALLERDGVYLYASEISSSILKNHYLFRHLATKIKSLPSVGCNILSIPSLADLGKYIVLQVTLIPAGHCPGSVMFFFELQQGNILYTGDFRLTLDNIFSLSDLHHKDGSPKELSAMYVDATFFDDLHPRFPKREESLEKVYYLTNEWLKKSASNEVLLHTPGNYGYEFIFGELNEKLGMKIHVPVAILNTLKNVKKIFKALTYDGSIARIHACERRNKLPVECDKPGTNFLRIRLSAMWYEKDYADKGIIAEELDVYTRVCYSTHCSKEELVDFIKYFLPKKVVACAVPREKTANEVEAEIMDTIKTYQRNSSGDSDMSEEQKISYSVRCQIRRKVMSSPRKKRVFVPHTPEELSNEPSPYCYSAQDEDLQNSMHQEQITVASSSVTQIGPGESELESMGMSVSVEKLYSLGEQSLSTEELQSS